MLVPLTAKLTVWLPETALVAVAVTVIAVGAVSEPALLLTDRLTVGITGATAEAILPGEPISVPSAARNAPLVPTALNTVRSGVGAARADRLVPALLSKVCPGMAAAVGGGCYARGCSAKANTRHPVARCVKEVHLIRSPAESHTRSTIEAKGKVSGYIRSKPGSLKIGKNRCIGNGGRRILNKDH